MASGSTPAYTYSWNTNPVQSNPVLSGVTVGTYICTILDYNNCTSSQSVTIVQPDVLQSSLVTSSASLNTGGNHISCYGLTDGSATVQASGGNGTYFYDWAGTGLTVQDLANVGAGIYTCNITDQYGCTEPVPFTVNLTEPTELTITISPVDIICFGGSDGSVTATISGGIPSYSYVWSNTTTNSSSQLSNTISGLSLGNYACTIYDANNCNELSNSVTINQPTLLTSNVIYTDSVNCLNGQDGGAEVEGIGATPAYTYSWNTNPVQNTAVLSAVIAGTYVCTITDDTSCTATQSVTIYEPSNSVTASIIAQDSVSCPNGTDGSAEVLASGGTPPYSYTWSNGTDGPILSGVTAGTYTCVVEDSHNCPLLFPVTILQPNPIIITITQDSVDCYGNTTGNAVANAVGGTPPYDYTWDNNPPGFELNNVSAGAYICHVEDYYLCSGVEIISVLQPDSFQVNATRIDISCFGFNDGKGIAHATGGTSPYFYDWSNNQTNDTAINLSVGQYSCTIIDGNSCPSEITNIINISEPTQLDAIVSSDSVSCFGFSDGSAVVLAFDARPPYTYEWNNLEINDTIISLNSALYSVDIMDSSGCVITRSTTVLSPLPLIAPIVSGSDSICFNSIPNTFYIDIPASGGGGENPYTYQWEDSIPGGNWDSVGVGNIFNSGQLSNSTYFRVSTKSDYGCGPVFSNLIYIKVWNSLQSGSLISDTVICFNTSAGLIQFENGEEPTGANNSYSYEWQDSSATTLNFTTVQTGFSPNFSAPILTEDTWYRVIVISNEGCGRDTTQTMKVNVFLNFIPGLIDATHDICFDESADTLKLNLGTNTGGNSIFQNNYQWQQSIDNLSFLDCSQPSMNDNYAPGFISDTTYFRLIIKNQCYSDDSLSNTIQVNVNLLPQPVIIDGDNLVCKNSSDVYFEVPDNQDILFYTWFFGSNSSSSFVNNQTHSHDCLVNFPDNSGTEKLFIERSFYTTGCSVSDSLLISISNDYTPDKCNIMKNKNAEMLVCDDVTSEINYQWGYYEINDSTNSFVYPSDTLQFIHYLQLHSHVIDTNKYRYWVNTWFDNDCKTRSYYSWNPSTLDRSDELLNELIIYPNPTISHLYYKYDGIFEIKIIDILGNEIKCNIDYNQKYITFNELSNGTYFLILKDKKQQIIKRFIRLL